ncbi:collagen alpha-2(IV) chain [Lucilia cuprina]|uniref:collagen alpha-2(IV) chain n=1 Tax=Lucilia cuprina TaxID=7375 RepID=UPI001F0535B5|nr:collagen alpha-2(IV) chain [Lucilia cuprina]
MQKLNNILILTLLMLNVCYAQDKWIWSKAKSNQKVRGYYPLADKRVYYTEDQYARAERDREPTTKRPLPGQPQNDDIDDYPDANDEPTKQNSPYPPGVIGNPRFGGNFNGFGNFPQIGAVGGGGYPGNIPNGILVGPGGPTGIIGRPQGQYPAGVAPPNFPLPQNGYPGNPVTPNFPGASVNSNPGYPGYNGLNNGFGQYPGQPSYANPNNPQQFAGSAQYPQYPQQPQYPGEQYPQHPQYTEGYGLANLNPGFNVNPGLNVNPGFNGNFNPNYGIGYDEYPAQVEGKSARVKAIDKKVDDKVAKNLKKL